VNGTFVGATTNECTFRHFDLNEQSLLDPVGLNDAYLVPACRKSAPPIKLFPFSAEVNKDWIEVQPFNKEEINRVMENYKRTKAIFAGTLSP